MEQRPVVSIQKPEPTDEKELKNSDTKSAGTRESLETIGTFVTIGTIGTGIIETEDSIEEDYNTATKNKLTAEALEGTDIIEGLKEGSNKGDENISMLEQERHIHMPNEKEAAIIVESKTKANEAKAQFAHIMSVGVDDLMFPETDEEVQRAKNLFSTVMDSERIKMMQFSSMLISGFGLRNYPSLCRALQYQLKLDEEYKRLKLKEEEEEMARLKRYRELERNEYRGETETTYSNLGSQTDFSTISATTHGDTTAEQRRRIEYLMGLHGSSDGGWEEDIGMSSPASIISKIKEDDKICDPEKEEPLTGMSDSMRQAQQYLRTHRIFEFFQFLIVHLLSKVPENPIEYLMVLLDKLLIYRTGMGTAPLHYKKRHLEQLFYLMDRMRTGFIDVQQYRTGMNTIGIKCFNSQPPLNIEGQVSKEFFLEEASQCSCHVLNNLIRVRKPDRSMRKKHIQFSIGGFQGGRHK